MPPTIPAAYYVAKQRLLDMLGNHWDVGDRLPPIAELASRLDTGQRNTGVAVRELASEGWLISQQRLGTHVTSRDGVDVPAVEMGQRAAMLLAERVQQPDQSIRNLQMDGTAFRRATLRRVTKRRRTT